MQSLQDTQRYQLRTEQSSSVGITYVPSESYSSVSLPTLTGNDVYNRETPTQAEQRLITSGELLATRLAKVLDQLRTYNQAAVYYIMSILEPYIEITPELDLRM